MRGIPKRFETARDVQLCVELAEDGALPKTSLKARLQAMLATGTVYVRDKVLASEDDADGPEPVYKIMQSETTDGETEIVQYKLVDNPSSAYALVGIDKETIEQYIARMEA